MAYGDLAWRLRSGRWLVAEADGASVHEAAPAILHDRTRANLIVATRQVDLIRFTWPDTTNADAVPRTLARILD